MEKKKLYLKELGKNIFQRLQRLNKERQKYSKQPQKLKIKLKKKRKYEQEKLKKKIKNLKLIQIPIETVLSESTDK